MKNRTSAWCSLAAFSLLVSAQAANSQTVRFVDIYREWPGYYNSANSSQGDVIGDPKIDSMDVIYDSGRNLLQKIVLNIAPTQGSAAKTEQSVTVRWDSLFINTSYVHLAGVTTTAWDQSWEYFVHTNAKSEADGVERGTAADIVGDVPIQGLFSVKDGFTPTLPQYSGNAVLAGNYGYTMVAKGSAGRKYHPDGIDRDFLELIAPGIFGVFASAKQSGTGSSTWWSYTITYDFTTLAASGLRYTDGFTVGYTPWCANDVILAAVSDPVPEPSTVLLFGTGIACFAGASVRRRRKHASTGLAGR